MSQPIPDRYDFPLPGGLCYPMVCVLPGAFIMGSEGEEAYDGEKPEHLVRLTHPYYIGVYPVTQAVWKALMDGKNPSGFLGDERPVERVSWEDIVEGGHDDTVPESFLARLNRRCSVQEVPETLRSYRFRLPTEAEWEYAAKGGHLTALTEAEIAHPPRADARYPLYAGSDKLKEVGWYSLNSHGEAKVVGLRRPNELGLYDMSGNVEEWCLDWYGTDYYQKCARQGIVEDPQGPGNGFFRVYRGGRWGYDPRFCRSAYRPYWLPSGRIDYVGVRLVFVP